MSATDTESPDELDEAAIEAAYERLCAAETGRAKRWAWAEMQWRIGARTPEQVEKLEIARGLRAK